MLIRAESTFQLGSGHVARCVALAQAWRRNGGDAVFLFPGTDRSFHSRAARDGFRLQAVRRSAYGTDDSHDIAALAEKLNAEWVVTDGTALPTDCFEMLRAMGVCTLAIDDGVLDIPIHADIVVNPNHHASSERHRTLPPQTRILAGAEYIILREDVLHARARSTQREGGTIRILLTIGGSDPDNITGRVLQQLHTVRIPDIELTVVIGALFARPERDWGSGFLFPVLIQSASDSLASVMANSDVAVICAGGTLWESLFLGVPVMSFSRNDVQHDILTSLAAEGLGDYLGRADDESIAAFGMRLASLCADPERRKSMARKGCALIDGRGADRIISEMKEFPHARH